MPHLPKRWLLVPAVSCALSGLFGCAPTINYALKSVPAESSLQLTEITADRDSVAGPVVYWKGKAWSYDVRSRFSLSADGFKLAYMSKQGGATGIVIRMLDGSYRTFRKPATGEAIDPVIAPDGSRMAFARCDHHAWNIFETSLDSNPAVRRVTNDPCYNLYPAYAADRKQLLFNHVELQQGREKGVAEPSWKLCSADLETSVLTEYGDGFSPSYAPGKNRAVAVRLNDSTQTTELWLIDLATGARSRLFGKPGQGVADPAVSPDGKVVAFVTMTEDSNTPANLDIYTMNMDGSSLTRRTFFPGQDLCPRWSGDGNSLYFLSQRNTESGEWNVWKMDLTGIPAAGAATDAKVQPASPVPVKPAVKEPSPPAPNSALQKSAVPAESPAQGGSLADTAKISPPPPPHDSTTQGGK